MKKDQVPQHKANLSKEGLKELCYATDEKGDYTTELSTGWEPKSIALEESMELIKERVAEAKEGVRNGVLSPVAYYMELNKMDVGILASYVGYAKWRVKRHLRAKVFNRLKESTLNKYAEVFNISVEQLKSKEL